MATSISPLLIVFSLPNELYEYHTLDFDRSDEVLIITTSDPFPNFTTADEAINYQLVNPRFRYTVKKYTLVQVLPLLSNHTAVTAETKVVVFAKCPGWFHILLYEALCRGGVLMPGDFYMKEHGALSNLGLNICCHPACHAIYGTPYLLHSIQHFTTDNPVGIHLYQIIPGGEELEEMLNITSL